MTHQYTKHSKKLIFCALIALSLITQNSSLAANQKEKSTGVNLQKLYTKTISLLEFNQDKKACDHLLKESESHNPNQLNFLLGKCHFKLKKYQKSIQYYDKILRNRPDATRVKLEKALSYSYLGRRSEAIGILVAVLKEKNIPINVRKRISRLINSLRTKKTKEKNWDIKLFAGFMIDDNINNAVSGTGIDLNGIPYVLGEADTGQKDHIMLVGVDYSYKKFLNSKKPLYLKTTLSSYNTIYGENEKYNLDIKSIYAGPGWSFEKLNAELLFSYSNVKLGGDNYTDSFGYIASGEYKFNKDWESNVSYSSSSSRYQQSTSNDFSGKNNSFDYGLKRNFGNNSFIQIRRTKGNQSAKQEYYAYDFSGFSAGIFTTTPKLGKFSPIGVYLEQKNNRRRYLDNEVILSTLARRDHVSETNLNLYKHINRHGTMLILSYSRTRNNSNVALYDYSRNQFMTRIEHNF